MVGYLVHPRRSMGWVWTNDTPVHPQGALPPDSAVRATKVQEQSLAVETNHASKRLLPAVFGSPWPAQAVKHSGKKHCRRFPCTQKGPPHPQCSCFPPSVTTPQAGRTVHQSSHTSAVSGQHRCCRVAHGAPVDAPYSVCTVAIVKPTADGHCRGTAREAAQARLSGAPPAAWQMGPLANMADMAEGTGRVNERYGAASPSFSFQSGLVGM